MEERRQHLRLSKSFVISYLLSNEILKAGGRSRNISEAGICLPLARRLDVGAVLDIEIRAADEKKPLTVQGEVIWVAARQDARFPFEAGIRFLKIDPATKTEIRGLVRQFVAEKGPDTLRWMEGA
jgi:hypothetical protein